MSRKVDWGRGQGLKRLGVHHLVLSPGEQSSLPHAESLEEEFVYVISGTPKIWIHHKLHAARPGDAAAFPAGTGICHSVMNDSQSEVELLVVGEQTKPDNKYFYPLHPEKRHEAGEDWWIHPPQVPDGLESPTGRPAFLKNIADLTRHKGFSYTGSTETFSEGVALAKDLGLSRIAVWHEVMEPGKRSSWPHAHSVEEEFIYLLSGQATLWLQGETKELRAGEGFAFVPGTGVAHTLLNRGTQNCEFLVCGEPECRNDKIFYPLHPKRNQECLRNGDLWQDPPEVPLGPDRGEP